MRNEGLRLYHRINFCYFHLVDTATYSIVVLSSHEVQQYLNWTQGAVHLKSLFKDIFSIRDIYLQH